MIEEIKPQPNADAIEMLEDALQKAKAGEIVAVSVAWVTPGSTIGSEYSSTQSAFLLWASLEHATKSYYADVITDNNYVEL